MLSIRVKNADIYKDIVPDLKNAQIRFIKITVNITQKINAKRKIQKALGFQRRENLLLYVEDGI